MAVADPVVDEVNDLAGRGGGRERGCCRWRSARLWRQSGQVAAGSVGGLDGCPASEMVVALVIGPRRTLVSDSRCGVSLLHEVRWGGGAEAGGVADLSDEDGGQHLADTGDGQHGVVAGRC